MIQGSSALHNVTAFYYSLLRCWQWWSWQWLIVVMTVMTGGWWQSLRQWMRKPGTSPGHPEEIKKCLIWGGSEHRTWEHPNGSHHFYCLHVNVLSLQPRLATFCKCCCRTFCLIMKLSCNQFILKKSGLYLYSLSPPPALTYKQRKHISPIICQY